MQDDAELADIAESRAQRGAEGARRRRLDLASARKRRLTKDLVRRHGLTVFDGQAMEVLAFWRKVCGHPKARLSPARIAITVDRLEDGFSAEHLRYVCAYAARTPSLRRFNDVMWLFQDTERVERLLLEAKEAVGGYGVDDRAFKRGDAGMLPGDTPTETRRF